MDDPFSFGQLFRLLVIFLSFLAMWSLWIVRRDRKHRWTSKTRDIWLVLFLWTVAAAEGNIELWYRHARPSGAIFLVVFVLLWTIKGVFNPDKLEKDLE